MTVASPSRIVAGPVRLWPPTVVLGLASLLFIAAVGCTSPAFDTGRLGRVQALTPTGSPRGLVFLFSGAAGWGSTEDRATTRLVESGAIVVGVDLASYRAALDASDGECLYLLSEIESLNQQVQRRFGVGGYLTPILAGSGEGGALVAATLAQTPAMTVAGVVAVDPAVAVATRLPLCAGAPPEPAAGGFVYGPKLPLPGFLGVGFTREADAAGRAHMLQVLAGSGGGRVEADSAASGTDESPGDLLARLVEAHLPPASTSSNPDLDASLVEVKGDAAGRPLAIVLSGDGGWRDLDKTIAETLGARGWNVVGWDSLRYFWHEKTPDRLAADLDAVIRRYRGQWATGDVVLIGFSFGADVLPFAYNRLSDESRSRVALVSLLAMAPTTDFEFHVTGWLGATSSDSVDNAAELERMPASLLQCFYGEDEEPGEVTCPALERRGVEVIHTAGGHHFDGDYEALARRVAEGFERRQAKAAPGGGTAPSR